MLQTIGLLILSNVFMTLAWYGHLKHLKAKPLVFAILVSWGIAFFEYCLQVQANRIGSQHYSLPQLKILQEVITLIEFVAYALFYAKVPVTKNFLYASLCILGAVYFIFRDGTSIAG